MAILRRTQFGNPILRTVARKLSSEEIASAEIQKLLSDMRETLLKKNYGVGLAAPQVGASVALAIVGLKPTPTRPKAERFNMIIINPKITAQYGSPTPMWEGCISGPELYGKAIRYEKITLKWLDENAQPHEQDFEGLIAQVLQHEVDHLNGILFVDVVADTKTYVTFSEYKKIKKAERKATPKG
jgi:peptide deformylase